MDLTDFIRFASLGYAFLDIGNISTIVKTLYEIRNAEESDLTELDALEEASWGPLRATKEQILSRIRLFPQGQWVAIVNGKCCGVIFTQRIAGIEDLSSISASNQHVLHKDGNPVVQLLGVAARNDVASLQLGEVLRDFALSCAHLDSSVTEVVAVTRCAVAASLLAHKNKEKAIESYEFYARSGKDPIISLHVSRGAEIVRIIDGYRPNDDENFGHGVVVRYSREDFASPPSKKNRSSSSPHGLTTDVLRGLICESLSGERSKAVASLPNEQFMTTAFMDFGLDSLALMGVRRQLAARLPSLNLSNTVLYDHPTPRHLFSFLGDKSNGASTQNPSCSRSNDISSGSSVSPHSPDQYFAITGMSSRFPGQTETDPQSFYEFLLHGGNGVGPVPQSWTCKTRHAAFLEPKFADSFDPQFFKISAGEVESMDPAQRLLLEVCHEALRASSSQLRSVEDRVGVYVGLSNNEWIKEHPNVGPYSSTGTAQSICANRISFALGLQGPSMVIDTACSSSLVALHSACNAIRCGDCDTAIVAAADLLYSQYSLEVRESAHMLATDGKTKAFDALADGYVRGEGVGAIVIRPLQKALEESSAQIFAIIRGSAVNQDGRSASLTAPNGSSQRHLLRAALQNSNVTPEQISYIEAHGTGTSLGDPIEFGAIREVFLDGAGDCRDPLIIGAVKTNIGHLEGAAGMAGLFKAVFSLRNRMIPGNLHFHEANPLLDLSTSLTSRKVIFPQVPVAFSSADSSSGLFAGISSFGSGGTNAHVILEGYHREDKADSSSPRLLTRQRSIEKESALQVGFMFTGQGANYANMGRSLFEAEPSFRNVILRCSKELNLFPSLVDVMYPSTEVDLHVSDRPIYSQTALFALQVGLCSLWASRGVLPSVVFGHSLGEYAAAVAVGVFTIEEAVRLVYLRANILGAIQTDDAQCMVAVRVSADVASRVIDSYAGPGVVTIAAINSTSSIVLSGNVAAVETVIAQLKCDHRRVPLDIAFHSSLLAPYAEIFRTELEDYLLSVHRKEYNPIRFISCLTGDVIELSELLTASYWYRQMLSTVKFLQCLEVATTSCGVSIEIGPQATLTKFAVASFADDHCLFVSSMEKSTDAIMAFDVASTLVQTEVSGGLDGRKGGRNHRNYEPTLFPWRALVAPDHRFVRGQPNPLNASAGDLYELVQECVSSVLPTHAINKLGRDTSLLSLGLDSLGAIAVRNTLCTRLQSLELPATLLLSHSTINKIVAYISTVCDTSSTMSDATDGWSEANDLPDNVECTFAASSMQRAMLFHHLADASAKSFLETFSWIVDGKLDKDIFYRAWLKTASSHSSLRSSFDTAAVPHPLQIVWTAASVLSPEGDSYLQSSWFEFESVSFKGKFFSGTERSGLIRSTVCSERLQGIDPTSPLLFRVKLVEVITDEVTEHIAVFSAFHAILDGWSMQVILKTLASNYAEIFEASRVSGRRRTRTRSINGTFMQGSSSRHVDASSYQAFSLFEQSLMASTPTLQSNFGSRRRMSEYWQKLLLGWNKTNEFVNIPNVKVDASDEEVFRCYISLSSEDVVNIHHAAKVCDVTAASFAHAAWCITYAHFVLPADRQLQSYDILYGCTTSGRSANVPGITNIVGPVINTFPVRAMFALDSDALQFVSAVHDQLCSSISNENYPLSEIQQFVDHHLRGNMFNAVFDYQNGTWDCDLLPSSLRMRCAQLTDRIGCALSIRIINHSDESATLAATSESIDCNEQFVTTLLRSYQRVLCALAKQADQGGCTIKEILCSGGLVEEFPLEMLCPLEFPLIPGISSSRQERVILKHKAKLLDVASSFSLSLEKLQLAIFAIVVGMLSTGKTFHLEHETHSQDYSVQLVTIPSLEEIAIGDLMANVVSSRQYHVHVVLQALFIWQGSIPLETDRAVVILAMDDGDDHDCFELVFSFPGNSLPMSVSQGICEKFIAINNFLVDQNAQGVLHLATLSHFAFPSVSPVCPPCTVPTSLLNDPFSLNARDHGQRYAISCIDNSDDELSFSYSEVDRMSNVIASKLISLRLRRTDENTPIVAVIMEKGWEQVVAVLGALKAMCSYLPVDARLWPEQRTRQVLELSGAMAVLTQGFLFERSNTLWLNDLSIPVFDVNAEITNIGESNLDAIPRASCTDLAYLIYTSGSTGVPKGVCCHHQGAMNTIEDLNEKFRVGPSDRVLALSSLSFDLSVYDIFGMLTAGGCIVIPPADSVSPPDPNTWLELVIQHKITIWDTVPAFMELLVSHVEFSGIRLPSCLRLIFMSGDWIPVSLPSRIRAASDCADIEIISMGGATEAAIWSNMFELRKEGNGIPEGWASVPYGQPMRNQTMYVLNSHMENCGPWVTGSIYIGGAGVAHGYYRNPERTAYQFVTHPRTGEKLFRTGDLGRVRAEGLIEILGREDSQVKVNGFRIELGEIERVLMRHPAVSSAALAVHKNMICAYLVLKDDCSLQNSAIIADIQKDCRLTLADYMMPQHFVILEEIPLSANGKVQREKLPAPSSTEKPTIAEDISTPTNYLESKLVEVVGQVLNLSSPVSTSANLFSVGVDSLRCIQIVALARKAGIAVSIPQIFSNPTIVSLSKIVVLSNEAGPDVLGTSSESVDLKPPFEVEHRPLTPCEPYPLIGINQAHYVGLHTSSYARGGMTPQIYFEWVIGGRDSTLSKDSLNAQLNVEHFQRALNLFIERHMTFRSIVRKDGRMEVLKDLPKYSIPAVSEFEGDVEAAERKAMKNREEMMSNGPGVYEWPLFEVRVTHTGPTESVVHLTVSLFLMDAMSDLILRQELSALYRASSSKPIADILPAPSRLQFKDYCIAMDSELEQSDDYKRAKKFWLSRLDSLFPGPELPIKAKNDGSGISSGRFVNQHRWMTAAEWRRAKSNCAAHAVTIPSVLLAAYSLTLAKWSTRDQFLLNILQCLRHQVHEDVNKMVGNCSSTILCNVDLSLPKDGPMTFKLAVQRVAQELSQNLEHASMSGVEVMQELNRVKGRTFSAVAPFIFTTPIGVEKGNRQVQSRNWMFQERFFSERVPHTACVNAIKADPSGTACASLDIVDGVFPKEVMKGMFDTYYQILSLICSPDSKHWAQDIEQFLVPASPVHPISPSVPITKHLLHDGFLVHRRHSSDDDCKNNAVICMDRSTNKLLRLCYREIDLYSNAVAVQLTPHVVHARSSSTSTSVVAVVMEKGWEQVVAVLSIFKCQCAYLPIDAKLWPEHRTKQVLELSGAVAVLTQDFLLEGSAAWLKHAGVPVINVNATASKDESREVEGILAQCPRASCTDLAYLIYTSGSTGVPKGVCCHHQGAMNTIEDLNEKFHVGPSDRVLALSSLSFDLSVYDIFGMLTAGGCIVIPPADSVSPPDPSVWMEMLADQKITIWNTVPAFMELLVSQAELSGLKLPACLRLIFMSGDWIPVSLPSRIRAASDCADIEIISMGGATEAAIWSNMFELRKEGNGIPEGWASVPYGQPMRNQTMYVLNSHMENCGPWVTGSIYIGGAGVAHGYYRNPERTAYQFVTHPRTGEKLFRTGDLGRVRPEGLIEILGREDSQVKVNGFRIELGEIERVILQHVGISSAALAVHKNSLCAYLVLKGAEFDADELGDLDYESGDTTITPESIIEDIRAECRRTLADYMMPQHFIILDELPLSSNGKVMREKLLSPKTIRRMSETDSDVRTAVEPRNEAESIVREMLAKVLKLDAKAICCRNANFFELGGNSLTAIQLLFGLRQKLGMTLEVQELFAAPTVNGIYKSLFLKDINSSNRRKSHSFSSSSSRLSALCLNQGHQTGPPIELPLILFNPAGASGLCYMELAKSLGTKRPIYVLDDGAMLNGRPFTFRSIEEVAGVGLPLIYDLAERLGVPIKAPNGRPTYTIDLAGWSYGGVVAAETAKQLAKDYKDHQGFNEKKVVVRSLFLFDAPLRSKAVDAPSDESFNPVEAKMKEDVAARAAQHFGQCTSLLALYHDRPLEQQPLTAEIVDIRPVESSYKSDPSAIREMTRGPIREATVPGTHWTMLFGDNVSHVSSILNRSEEEQ